MFQLSPSSSFRTTLRTACELGVGLLIVSAALRTWVVEGLVPPVRVSGDSMAPTLRGNHRQLRCNRCGLMFACGSEQIPERGFALCPNCDSREVQVYPSVERVGDRVLIDRTGWQPVERWQVAVFRCPTHARNYCIKRIVGLPGETIEIRQGEVRVNGRIARKPLSVARAVSQLVYQVRKPAQMAALGINRFVGQLPGSAWQTDSNHFVHPRSEASSPVETPTGQPQPPIDWLVYRHPQGRPVCDDSGYNQTYSWRPKSVADLKLSFRVTLDRADTLWLRALERADQFEAQINLVEHQATLRRNGQMVGQWPLDNTIASQNLPVEWWVLDEQIVLVLDGTRIFEFPYEPSDRSFPCSAEPLALGVGGVAAVISELQVWRDVFYTHPAQGGILWGITQPAELAKDEFFVLGDNSPLSHDSRTLASPGLPANLMIGKVIGLD